jgi:hypothetical protein
MQRAKTGSNSLAFGLNIAMEFRNVRLVDSQSDSQVQKGAILSSSADAMPPSNFGGGESSTFVTEFWFFSPCRAATASNADH